MAIESVIPHLVEVTESTHNSFANPAVTIARGFTNTFSGIDLSHVPMFILSQFAGATVALLLIQFLFSRE